MGNLSGSTRMRVPAESARSTAAALNDWIDCVHATLPARDSEGLCESLPLEAPLEALQLDYTRTHADTRTSARRFSPWKES